MTRIWCRGVCACVLVLPSATSAIPTGSASSMLSTEYIGAGRHSLHVPAQANVRNQRTHHGLHPTRLVLQLVQCLRRVFMRRGVWYACAFWDAYNCLMRNTLLTIITPTIEFPAGGPLPPFAWTQFPTNPQEGLPPVYDFNFEVMTPAW